MRKFLLLFLVLAFARVALASPGRHYSPRKIRRRNSTERFQKLSGAEQVFTGGEVAQTRTSSSALDELLLSDSVDYLKGEGADVIFSKKLVLSGSLTYRDPNRLPLTEEYLKVSKGASVGVTYPLSSKLFLNGQYVLLNGDAVGNTQQQLQIPLFQAVYRLNTKTSISISYKDVNPGSGNTISGETHHTDAELKIHF